MCAAYLQGYGEARTVLVRLRESNLRCACSAVVPLPLGVHGRSVRGVVLAWLVRGAAVVWASKNPLTGVERVVSSAIAGIITEPRLTGFGVGFKHVA